MPKFLVSADGSIGERNDVRAHSVEHKMGIHASPTCTMVFGDKGGAKAWLVGQENAGMACMFTMMNNARLSVGIGGVGIAERATQQAAHYARERKQGRNPGMPATQSVAIVDHVDVQRMLLTMSALTRAARAICYATAVALDRAHRGKDEAARKAGAERAALLTPVAKAFSTDIGTEVASLGVQVHGGMGYIEETGAAQHYRDARIAQIYEGTNGIQSIDLVTRKITMNGGATVKAYLDELRAIVKSVRDVNDPAFGATAQKLEAAIGHLARATDWLLAQLPKDQNAALAGATHYLRMFGNTAGGCMIAGEAVGALRSGNGRGDAPRRVAIARFFAETIAVQNAGLADAIVEGAGAVNPAALPDVAA